MPKDHSIVHVAVFLAKSFASHMKMSWLNCWKLSVYRVYITDWMLSQ